MSASERGYPDLHDHIEGLRKATAPKRRRSDVTELRTLDDEPDYDRRTGSR